MSFHVEQLVDDKAVQGLERGFTSEIVHDVQLWQIKGVISRSVQQHPYIIRVYHDNWSQKFAVITDEENRLTSQIETLRRMCSTVKSLSISTTAALDNDSKYFVTITTTFQPISDETYSELRAWVSGRSSDHRNRPVKRGRFFGFLIDLLGFGDKAVQYKSMNFTIHADGTLHFVQ